MAITALDSNSALIVIDLQKGITSLPTAHPMSEVLRKAGALAAAFRRHDLPVVLVNVAGSPPGRAEETTHFGELPPDWIELLPELDQHAHDHVVTKKTWGAFTDTDLRDYLTSHSVTEVVLAGVATSIGVESTARHAYELGFHVAIAVDATTDSKHESHEHSITRIFPRLSETGTAQEIIDLLDQRVNAR